MRWTALTAIFVCALFAVSLYADAAARGLRRDIQDRVYDPDTETTVSGTVVSVDEYTRPGGRNVGVHVVLNTDDGKVYARLGPKWYIDNLNLDLKKGDKIEVTGSKIQVDEDIVIIVKSLTRGEDTVLLRDEDGVPFWSGWRKGGMGRRGGMR